MAEATANGTDIKTQVTLSEVNSIIDDKLKDIDDPRPTEAPPKGVSLSQLEKNAELWKKLRDTRCDDM